MPCGSKVLAVRLYRLSSVGLGSDAMNRDCELVMMCLLAFKTRRWMVMAYGPADGIHTGGRRSLLLFGVTRSYVFMTCSCVVTC